MDAVVLAPCAISWGGRPVDMSKPYYLGDRFTEVGLRDYLQVRYLVASCGRFPAQGVFLGGNRPFFKVRGFPSGVEWFFFGFGLCSRVVHL